VAFQMGYRMAQRDKETFNPFQDEKHIADSGKMYRNVLYGKPPYPKEEERPEGPEKEDPEEEEEAEAEEELD